MKKIVCLLSICLFLVFESGAASGESITIISPNGSEQLYGGTVKDITWVYEGSVGDKVTIEYATQEAGSETWVLVQNKAGSFASGIDISVKKFTWMIPSATDSITCKVRITTNSAAPFSDTSDSCFRILRNSPPTQPAVSFDLNPVQIDQTVIVSCSTNDPESDSISSYVWLIWYPCSGGFAWWFSSVGTGEFSLSEPGNYRIGCAATDEHGAQSAVGVSELIVGFENAPPLAPTLSLNSCLVAPGADFTICSQSCDPFGENIAAYRWGLKAPGSTAIDFWESPSDFSCQGPLNKQAPGQYTVVGQAKDSSGNWSDQSQTTLFVDTYSVTTNRAVCLGDSLTYGYGGQAPDSYPSKLSYSTGMQVFNKGINGDRITNMNKRFDADVGSYAPRYCVLLGGINDVGNGVMLPDIKNAFSGIFNKAQAAQVELIVVSLLPFKNSGYWSSVRQAMVDELNQWLREQCDGSQNRIFIDAYTALEDPAHSDALDPLYDLWDHLHLNAAGNAKLAETIYTQVFLQTIKGAVSGVHNDGVRILISGDAAYSSYTHDNGLFGFNALGDGTYTITPELPGHCYSPAFQQVTVAGSSVSDVNFTAIDDLSPSITDEPVLLIDGSPILSSDPAHPTVTKGDTTIVWAFNDDVACCRGPAVHTWEYRAAGDSAWIPQTPGTYLRWVWVEHPASVMSCGSYEFRVAITDCAAQTTTSPVYYVMIDQDEDGAVCSVDNCPSVYNPQQGDADGDDIGDCCDPSPGCGGCGQEACDTVCAL